VLRLTGNTFNQTGYALYTEPVAADRGLNISFNMYQYNATTKPGADGISFLLVNGNQAPSKAGAFGGALGYKGLTGGYLGVGFDEFGNYSTKMIWGNGTSQKEPNSIVIRGAQSAGYPQIRRVLASQPLASDAATARSAAMRHVVISISTSGVVTVKVDYGRGPVTEISKLNLNDTPGQPPLPSTVKFGFAGSTGNNTDIHEVSNLTISALPPDLHTVITPQGIFEAGGTGTFSTVVSDDAAAGRTTGPVTVTDTVPAGFVPQTAQGSGWSCTIAGQQVTCTRPDTLLPGTSYPPFTITTSVPADAPPTVNLSASATTPDQVSPADAQAAVTVPITPGPDLSTTVTPVGQFSAPGVGTYLLNVSNAATAGPTHGPVTETFPVPAGQTPLSASGSGWSCSRSGQLVTCTNPGALQAGQSAQPIVVTVQNTPCVMHPVATVSTVGDTGQPAETSPAVSVPFSPATES
jgi:Bacterial lectin